MHEQKKYAYNQRIFRILHAKHCYWVSTHIIGTSEAVTILSMETGVAISDAVRYAIRQRLITRIAIHRGWTETINSSPKEIRVEYYGIISAEYLKLRGKEVT